MRHSTVSNLFCVFSSATKAAAGVGRLDGGGGSPPRPITPAPCYRCRCCGVTARAPSFRPRCRGSFLLTCFSSGHACQRVTEQGIHPADEQSQTSSRPVTAMMRFPPAGYFGSGRLQPLFTQEYTLRDLRPRLFSCSARRVHALQSEFKATD
jgi:hypothetical protein